MAGRRLGFWRRFAVVVLKPPLILLTMRTWHGMEHIPKQGGVILAVNHISDADPMVSAHFIYDSGRWPQVLGKHTLFTVPLLGWFLRQVRQIPVYRNSTDAVKALHAAIEAVETGGAVVIYPEGTITREPDLWPRRGKTGVARLAMETGAPVVPVCVWGAERLFDSRTNKARPVPRTPVTVVAGPPIDLTRWAGQPPSANTLTEMTEHVMLVLRDMLAQIRGGTPPPLYGRNGRNGNGSSGSDADGRTAGTARTDGAA